MALIQFESITINRGCSSLVEIDFSGFDFQGGKCTLSLEDAKKNVLATFDFAEARKYIIEFTPEITKDFANSKGLYVYDIVHHTGAGNIYPQCLPSQIIVVDSVGGLK